MSYHLFVPELKVSSFARASAILSPASQPGPVQVADKSISDASFLDTCARASRGRWVFPEERLVRVALYTPYGIEVIEDKKYLLECWISSRIYSNLLIKKIDKKR